MLCPTFSRSTVVWTWMIQHKRTHTLAKKTVRPFNVAQFDLWTIPVRVRVFCCCPPEISTADPSVIVCSHSTLDSSCRSMFFFPNGDRVGVRMFSRVRHTRTHDKHTHTDTHTDTHKHTHRAGTRVPQLPWSCLNAEISFCFGDPIPG